MEAEAEGDGLTGTMSEVVGVTGWAEAEKVALG